jgi:hypothetical protein
MCGIAAVRAVPRPSRLLILVSACGLQQRFGLSA